MIELIRENKPTFLAVKRPKRLAVVGADLDLSLCRSLTAGDKVLMEVNGVRVYSTESNPMVAEHPWEVVSNDFQAIEKRGKLSDIGGHLVLRHPNVENDFRLDYASVLPVPKNHPCVFVETNDDIQPGGGTLFVVLQLIGYYISEDRVAGEFPPPKQEDIEEFEEMLEDDRVKVGLLEEWHKAFRKIREGWTYLSDFRIASLANIRVTLVRAIKSGDFKTMLTMNDEELAGLFRACYWLPMLVKQSSLIGHDAERTYEYREVTGK